MSVPTFDPREFYRFSNAIFFNTTISAVNNDIRKDRQIHMFPVAASSTENWQLFEQGGRFFLRNFDSGPDLQLGLARNNLEQPLMYEKGGSLSQQWEITENNGKYVLTNALAGRNKFLVADTEGNIQMQSIPQGSEWTIEKNPSAADSPLAPSSPDMLGDVQNFEELPSSSSSSSIMISTATNPSSNTLSSPAPSSTGLAGNSNNTVQTTSSSPALSGGAIAGIIIGAIAILAAIIFAVWFFLFRKKKAQEKYELSNEQAAHFHQPSEKYAYTAELSTPAMQTQVWEADSRTGKRPAQQAHELA